MNEIRFDDRVAIVTGAGRGIGRAHALGLARRGAKVVVNDLGGDRGGRGVSGAPAQAVVDEILAAGGTAVASFDSVATREGATRIVATALEHYGRLDVVVNNAGIVDHKPFLDLDRESFDRMLAVHLGGTYEVTHAAWPHLLERGYGRVVFTTSASGLFGEVHHAHYSAAKAGTVGLARSLAIEAEGTGITVNVVAPAAFTRMVDESLPAGELKDWFVDSFPADTVAEVVAWLAHEECTVSGETFGVYGAVVLRHVTGSNRGCFLPVFTAEGVRERFAEIREPSGLTFAGGTLEELERVGGILAAKKAG